MATPTPTTYTQWDGTRGYTHWNAVWTTTDNFAAEIVVDISSLGGVPAAVKVIGVKATLNGDITATLDFDATTDQLIYVWRNQTDSSLVDEIDFREAASGGKTGNRNAAGWTGDILLTTTNVASGDELTLDVFYQRR